MSDIVERLRVIIQNAQLPWRSDLNDVVRDDPNDDDPWTVAHCGVGEGMAELIAESINAIPLLIARIAKAEQERDNARTMLFATAEACAAHVKRIAELEASIADMANETGWMANALARDLIADEREDAARAAYLQGYSDGAEDEKDDAAHKDSATEGWVNYRDEQFRSKQ